jgi:hypothetical protein
MLNEPKQCSKCGAWMFQLITPYCAYWMCKRCGETAPKCNVTYTANTTEIQKQEAHHD